MDNAIKKVVIIGGGFSGLAAGLELIEKGHHVTILEKDTDLGGLAGAFDIEDYKLEKFYHHWFTSDIHVMEMIQRLNMTDNVVLRPTRTGMYYANRIFRLTNPLDVLKFTPLNLIDRIRLGWLVFQVRKIKDWHELENLTVKEWLTGLCGKKVYEVVWEPLMTGKFGPFADDISAVWLWKKLVLRGGSRGKAGSEMLAYYKGGFIALAEAMAKAIENKNGVIKKNTPVKSLIVSDGKVTGVKTDNEEIPADIVIATPALPIIADLLQSFVPDIYEKKLRRINYLANICLVLELKQSLSKTYWLNINDPTFPFVGIIEHTNFEPTTSYGNKHIVYLSKYLPKTDKLYSMSNEEIFKFSLPHLQKMFPEFNESWVSNYYVWHADYAQPIIEKHYSDLMPGYTTPLENFYICTMAQVYPEDRGTNYAIREGIKVASLVVKCA